VVVESARLGSDTGGYCHITAAVLDGAQIQAHVDLTYRVCDVAGQRINDAVSLGIDLVPPHTRATYSLPISCGEGLGTTVSVVLTDRSI
jgi:hypothetical protein